MWKSGFDHCGAEASQFVAWLPRANDRAHGNYISSMSKSAHLKKKLATITDVLCISYFSFLLKHVKQGSKRVKALCSRALSDLKRSWALETSAALGQRPSSSAGLQRPRCSIRLFHDILIQKAHILLIFFYQFHMP